MLIQSDYLLSQRSLVAIGVDEWDMKGEYRCFDLVPYETETDIPFVEVGVITTLKRPAPVVPEMPDWGPITHDGHQKDEFGYPLTNEAAEDLYYVWDDGATQHMERAQRLYKYFKPRIDFYREAALKFHLEQFEGDRQLAKEKGWDPALIQKPTAYRYFPHK